MLEMSLMCPSLATVYKDWFSIWYFSLVPRVNMIACPVLSEICIFSFFVGNVGKVCLKLLMEFCK